MSKLNAFTSLLQNILATFKASFALVFAISVITLFGAATTSHGDDFFLHLVLWGLGLGLGIGGGLQGLRTLRRLHGTDERFPPPSRTDITYSLVSALLGPLILLGFIPRLLAHRQALDPRALLWWLGLISTGLALKPLSRLLWRHRLSARIPLFIRCVMFGVLFVSPLIWTSVGLNVFHLGDILVDAVVVTVGFLLIFWAGKAAVEYVRGPGGSSLS